MEIAWLGDVCSLISPQLGCFQHFALSPPPARTRVTHVAGILVIVRNPVSLDGQKLPPLNLHCPINKHLRGRAPQGSIKPVRVSGRGTSPGRGCHGEFRTHLRKGRRPRFRRVRIAVLSHGRYKVLPPVRANGYERCTGQPFLHLTGIFSSAEVSWGALSH
jgi:hypothetical protein